LFVNQAVPFPNQDYSKRDYLLPAGCKDLTDAINREGESFPLPTPDPPITRRITLPEKVSVQFLAETSGKSIYVVAALMSRLRIFVSVQRSMDFDDAAKVLRKFGIEAIRTT
jgi:hypothetical protein